jgi:hypothetical protein
MLPFGRLVLFQLPAPRHHHHQSPGEEQSESQRESTENRNDQSLENWKSNMHGVLIIFGLGDLTIRTGLIFSVPMSFSSTSIEVFCDAVDLLTLDFQVLVLVRWGGGGGRARQRKKTFLR